MINLMLLTADPVFAAKAQDAGVDRIFLDLEFINKIERQQGRNTYISPYSLEDIPPLRRVLDTAQLLVRVNPIHPHSKTEIDRVIEAGADILMLPMVVDRDDVERFIDMVGGRARTCPMIETAQAMARLDDIIEVNGIDELFIGLNDLHISLSSHRRGLQPGLLQRHRQRRDDRQGGGSRTAGAECLRAGTV